MTFEFPVADEEAAKMTVAKYLGYPGFYSTPRDLSLNYTDYLQARQFVDSVRWEISRSTRALLTASDVALDAQVSAIEREGERTNNALFELKYSVAALSAETAKGFKEIGTLLDWGFSTLAAETARMADSLDQLVRIARTPSQTWAYEQFNAARDELRRKLYPEALASVGRAVHGFGGQVGYQSEWRFHFLLGLLKLGDYENTSEEIVNLREARSAFEASARYAASDFPSDAASSLMFAARAANLLGDSEAAVSLSERSLEIQPTAGAFYESAVAYSSINNHSECCVALVEAFRRDPRLAIKATGDNAFQSSRFLKDSLSLHLEELQGIVKNCERMFDKNFDSVTQVRYVFYDHDIKTFETVMSSPVERWRTWRSRTQGYDHLGIIDLRQVIAEFVGLCFEIDTSMERFRSNLIGVLDEKRNVVSSEFKLRTERIPKSSMYHNLFFAGSLIGIPFLVGLWGYESVTMDTPIFNVLLWLVFFAASIIGGFFLALASTDIGGRLDADVANRLHGNVREWRDERLGALNDDAHSIAHIRDRDWIRTAKQFFPKWHDLAETTSGMV